MKTHVCISAPYKNQGRCVYCGKFMQPPITVATTAPKATGLLKDIFISELRNDIYIVSFTDRFNKKVNRMVTLKPSFLKNYVGSGKSKQTPDNIIFAYDIIKERMISIDITTIEDKSKMSNVTTNKELTGDELTKDIIIKTLKENICEVVFTKKNGDKRTMLCTLLPDYLSDYKSKGMSKTSDNSVSVWDIDADGFRSFVIDRIKTFKIVG